MAGIAVVGVPAHNGERYVDDALGSLLAQTYPETRIVVLDDASTDRTPELLATLGPLTVERSDRQLGLIAAWRRVFDLALETFPDARYFAWGSDHDRWEPTWLEELVAALERNPAAVFAYPVVDAIDEDGQPLKRRGWRFDTVGVDDRSARLAGLARARRAGDMIYGLARVDALRRCGPFPAVLRPDRLMLGRLALEGEFVQVDKPLWHRRYRTGVVASVSRQRRTLWADDRPWWAWTPSSAQQWVWLAQSLPGEPAASRASLATRYVAGVSSLTAHEWRKRRQRNWKWRRKRWRASAYAARQNVKARLGPGAGDR